MSSLVRAGSHRDTLADDGLGCGRAGQTRPQQQEETQAEVASWQEGLSGHQQWSDGPRTS